MTAEADGRNMAEAALALQAERLQERLPNVREDRDPKHLRGLREAYSWARHALKLFAPVFGKHRADALRERLRETRKALGPLRELDMATPVIEAFLEQGAAALEPGPPRYERTASGRPPATSRPAPRSGDHLA